MQITTSKSYDSLYCVKAPSVRLQLYLKGKSTSTVPNTCCWAKMVNHLSVLASSVHKSSADFCHVWGQKRPFTILHLSHPITVQRQTVSEWLHRHSYSEWMSAAVTAGSGSIHMHAVVSSKLSSLLLFSSVAKQNIPMSKCQCRIEGISVNINHVAKWKVALWSSREEWTKKH